MLFRRQLDEQTMRAYYPAIFAEAPHEDTSERYLYIPTHRLVNKLVENGFSVAGAAQTRGKSREHAKHVVYMTAGEYNPQSLRKVGDEIPLLKITNSHDARSSFKLDTAFFRLICSNGLMMPERGHNSARIRHTTNMVGEVVDAAFSVTKEFPEQLRVIGEMKNIQLSNDEQHLLAESAKNLVFDEKTIELNQRHRINLEERLLRRRHWEDRGKNDLWTTFNAVQENVMKGGVRVFRESPSGKRAWRSTRPVESIDRSSKLNQELMTLAQKFAELKRGA